ncbi:MAG: hypothetical protein P8129_03270, partial [Anaerolineae bacterium]
MFEMFRRLQEMVYRRPLQAILTGWAAVLTLGLVSCLVLAVAGTALGAIWLHRGEPAAQVAISSTPSPTAPSGEMLSPLHSPLLPTATPDAGQPTPTALPPTPTPPEPAAAISSAGTTGAEAAEAGAQSQPVTLLSPVPTQAPVDAPRPESALELTPTSQLTLSAVIWIENVGQFPQEVRYQVRSSSGSGLWLAADALWMTLLGPEQDEMALLPEPLPAAGVASSPPAAAEAGPQQGLSLRFSFEGANPNPEIVPFGPLDTQVSYFIGADPAAWRTEVPIWRGVRYRNLYPGIDLELTARGRHYVQRLVLHPGADPDAVRLRVEGAAGLSLEGPDQEEQAAYLRVTTALGDVRWPLFEVVTPDGSPAGPDSLPEPRLDGDQVLVAPFYASSDAGSGGAGALALGLTGEGSNLDDGGLLGQGGNDGSYDVAVDAGRGVYVTGYTYRPAALGPAGPFDAAAGSRDAFVLKLGAGTPSLAAGGTFRTKRHL